MVMCLYLVHRPRLYLSVAAAVFCLVELVLIPYSYPGTVHVGDVGDQFSRIGVESAIMRAIYNYTEGVLLSLLLSVLQNTRGTIIANIIPDNMQAQ